MKLKLMKPDFSAKDFFRLYSAISMKGCCTTITDDLFSKIYKAKKDNEEFNFLFEDVASRTGIDFGYVDLDEAFQDAYFSYLSNIYPSKDNIRAYIIFNEQEIEEIISSYDKKYVLAMQEIFNTVEKINISIKNSKIKKLN